MASSKIAAVAIYATGRSLEELAAITLLAVIPVTRAEILL